MLSRPALRFRPDPHLLAERLVAVLLATHPAAGRPGRGRAAGNSPRPALYEGALTLVRWSRDGKPFSQRRLAAVFGLSRPTVVHYLSVWSRAGLVVRVDDEGRPVAHGTTHPAGTAARWRLETRWTPDLVELMPARWRPRLDLAWAALQSGAADELIGSCLRRVPACNGDRVLWAWYGRAVRKHARRARRERAACRRAAELARRLQRDQVEGMAATLGPLAEFEARNSTPPQTESSPLAPRGPLGLAPGIAQAREARAAPPLRGTEVSAEQLRRIVDARLTQDVTQGEALFAELAAAARRLDEDDPVSLFGALANLAVRRQWRLDDLVGRYCRAVDQVVVDIGGRVRQRERDPVTNPAAFAWRMLRYEAGDLPRPPRRGGPRWPVAAEADVEDQVVDVSGRLPLYEPEPEPAPRRRSLDELRAIRARALADRGARGTM